MVHKIRRGLIADGQRDPQTAASLAARSTASSARSVVTCECARSSAPAPFRYLPFLEYATTLLFLERNGGAYRFRHDLLQEYFAALT
jgi:hypothetical protein